MDFLHLMKNKKPFTLRTRVKMWSMVILIVLTAFAADGQVREKRAETKPVHGSPAYAELALKRVQATAELESLLVEYTEEFPKIKELKFLLSCINIEISRLEALRTADIGRATIALGKLMSLKIDGEVELHRLSETYADEHTEVKRAKKKVEIFEKAIKEILG